jgi:hypothetical protein
MYSQTGVRASSPPKELSTLDEAVITNHFLSLFDFIISWSVASFRFHAEGPLPARKKEWF